MKSMQDDILFLNIDNISKYYFIASIQYYWTMFGHNNQMTLFLIYPNQILFNDNLT